VILVTSHQSLVTTSEVNRLSPNILVLGVGNVLLQDDGIGPLVVKELEKTYFNPHVTFLDGGTLGIELIGYLEGYDSLIIIDAFDLGEKPGTIFCWESPSFSEVPAQVSFHQVGVQELLNTIKLLGLNLEIIILGIQVKNLTWGLELSKEVQEAVSKLKEIVVEKINQCLTKEVTGKSTKFAAKSNCSIN